ncbi:MAG: hypothetical protein A2173_05005 [Planctomycetes bacterium RBG_13_44_8b]|nr:MAG: hypothetical protein A2173_05005 [Planctomycetes bacterium RBG_13_44_8b]
MNISFETIISLISAIGFGGLLGAWLEYRFQCQKQVQEDIHRLKRERYGAILIQMLTILSPEHLLKTQKFRPDLKTIEDVKEEVRTEMLHGVLFASDEVVKAMAEFVRDPNHSSYFKTVAAMRKDLWRKKTKIKEDDIEILVKTPIE